MANDYSSVVAPIFTAAAAVPRRRSILPMLVSNVLDMNSGQLGETVKVPIAAPKTPKAVPASGAYPTRVDNTPSTADIVVNQHRMAEFDLSDKQRTEIISGGPLPTDADEAIKALVDECNQYIAEQFKFCYNLAGTAGTTPFASDYSAFTAARKEITKVSQMTDLSVVLDADAYANALGLAKLVDADVTGDTGAIQAGAIGMRLGASWHELALMHTHDNETTGTWQTSAAATVGSDTISVDSGGGDINPGDLFTVDGSNQRYAVRSTTTGTGTAGVLTVFPAVTEALADNADLTFVGDRVINPLFARGCVGLRVQDAVGRPGRRACWLGYVRC